MPDQAAQAFLHGIDGGDQRIGSRLAGVYGAGQVALGNAPGGGNNGFEIAAQSRTPSRTRTAGGDVFLTQRLDGSLHAAGRGADEVGELGDAHGVKMPQRGERNGASR